MARSQELQRKWKNRIAEQRMSGLSIQKWCEEHQVSKQQFHYWKTRLAEPELQVSSFTQLPNEQKKGIVIECGNLSVRLEKGFDATTLRECLSVLCKLPC